MGKPRFKEPEMGSCFGDFVYWRVVPRDHFLVKLNGLIDWEALVPILLPAYEGRAEAGRPPYSPIVLLKMLLITYLYNLSERQTEEVVNYQLPVKEFVGLAVDEAAPDHSTLCLFKRRLREAGRWERFAAVSDAVLQQAQAAGVRLGEIQVVDSVHSVADIDNEADRLRQERGHAPRDSDAQVVKKGQRAITQPDGKVEMREIQYRGYKSHISLNAEAGLITTVHPTPGNVADNVQFPHLLAHDEALGLPGWIYTGDRAYDDTDQHVRLWDHAKFSAFHLHGYRTQKKDANKELWQQLQTSPDYVRGLKERYKIERKFGEGKLWHKLGRCRYLGLVRYGIQAILTALVLNLKRIVYLLTGVHFKSPSHKRVLVAG